jgi:lipopolysaccharide exporter
MNTFRRTVTNTYEEEGSKEKLSHRVIKGGFWVFSIRLVQQILGFARLIILARILSPQDFGLFGIALLAMSALETFSQTGFDTALVQKKQDIKSYLDTAWTVQLIRGIVLAAIAFTIAPYVATFFDAPIAKPILQVIALSELIRGFTNIGVVYFQKELEFHKQFIYSLSGMLADMGVAISTALFLRSVWALVFGLLAGNLVRLIVSYFVHPYRPQLNFNLQQFKELSSFGIWVLSSSILLFLITHGDDALVGKVLGVTALGFYQLAYRLSNMPATEVTHVISQVTFPAYSKLQDNLPKLKEAYLKVLQLTAFLSFPIAGLIFVLTPDFTMIFLGKKWMSMVPAMQVLVFAGLARSIAATTGPVFLAMGKPKIETQWQIVRLLILAASIWPLTIVWGIVGSSIAVLLSTLVSTFGFLLMALKITRSRTLQFAKTIAFPWIGGALLVISVLTVKAMSDTVGMQHFLLLATVGGLTYLSVIYLLDRFMNYRIWAIIRTLA